MDTHPGERPPVQQASEGVVGDHLAAVETERQDHVDERLEHHVERERMVLEVICHDGDGQETRGPPDPKPPHVARVSLEPMTHEGEQATRRESIGCRDEGALEAFAQARQPCDDDAACDRRGDERGDCDVGAAAWARQEQGQGPHEVELLFDR